MSSSTRTHVSGRRRLAARLLGERGAAAVEFALVAPVLLLLLLGIVDFSKKFNNESTLSAAAREGAREMALTNDKAAARKAVKRTAEDLGITDAQITFEPADCATLVGGKPATITVTVRYQQSAVGGLLGGFNLSGKAAMRCGG